MKVFLINPKYSYTSLNPTLKIYLEKKIAPTFKPLSLPLLTVGGLFGKDVEVEYLDDNFGDIDCPRNADLVCIGFMTPQSARAYEIADEFRKRGSCVVLGGIHATVLPDEAIKHANAVVVGDAEGVFPDLIRDFKRGSLKNFYKGPFPDIKKSPLPRYDLIKERHFANLPNQVVSAQFSRGCPRNCSFCSVSRYCGKKLRSKTGAQISAEIRLIKSCSCLEGRQIAVLDANPFVNISDAQKKIRTIAKNQILWISMAEISIADNPALLDLLRKSNCRVLNVGLESLESDVLGDVSPWKKSRLSSYVKSLRIINEHGIVVTGNFMLGFKPYKKDMLRRIRDFVLENHVMSQYFIATPYPGTKFYEDLDKEGRLRKDLGWDCYNAYNLVFDMGMDPNEVAEDLCWLFEETLSDDNLRDVVKFYEKVWNMK